MASNGKERRITNLVRGRKQRHGGAARKRKLGCKSTLSYAELFGEDKASFDARHAKD